MKEGICYICGNPIKWDEENENCVFNDFMDEDGTVSYQVTCSHCGTLYEYYTDKECFERNEDYVSCGDQGFGKCMLCGGNVAWSGDFMRSDYDEELDDNDDAIVRSLVCGGCGCHIEAWEPSPNEVIQRDIINGEEES